MPSSAAQRPSPHVHPRRKAQPAQPFTLPRPPAPTGHPASPPGTSLATPASYCRYDRGGPNDVKLPYNPCGCVYKMQLDTSNSATGMTALFCGKLTTCPDPNDPDAPCDTLNVCDVDAIASPDNLSYLSEVRSLQCPPLLIWELSQHCWHWYQGALGSTPPPTGGAMLVPPASAALCSASRAALDGALCLALALACAGVAGHLPAPSLCIVEGQCPGWHRLARGRPQHWPALGETNQIWCSMPGQR